MRIMKTQGDFKVKAIAGIRTVLIALDCAEPRRHGLLGFAFQREVVGSGDPPKWLRSQKVFRSIEPDPKNARDPQDPSKPKRFYTNAHPIQSFLWGDYGAQPDTQYRFTVVPMYGTPGNLQPAPSLTFDIRTEKEFTGRHGVWFNRGAIASQAFADEFRNMPPQNVNDPADRTVKWLSRGLLEACLGFIDNTPAGEGLRVAAYEFTYPPVLNALKRALDRGVDVRIIYHDTTTATGKAQGANEAAIKAAGLPSRNASIGARVLHKRTKTKIPHNKFMVRLDSSGAPSEVWTGSTNFTPSGFLGQSNVGHWVRDAATAQQYLDYWEVLRTDPDRDQARAEALQLTPDPKAVIAKNSIVALFSPRAKADLLKWYAGRMEDSASSLMFTAAFGIAKQLVPAIAAARPLLRFVLMEKPATDALKTSFQKDRRNIILSYGVPLGEQYTFKNGKPTARRPIKDFELVKWFLEEEHYRRKNEGFVFFVHTKFLLIDPLSDDPLVCSGSANFSSNSLLQNDENMLFIRGDTRVADIYMTEFDRLFRHFYFRGIANELEAQGNNAKAAFLDEQDQWHASYFWKTGLKSLRRQMFFANPRPTWFEKADARAVTGPAVKTTGRTSGRKTTRKTARKTARKSVRKTTRKTARKRSTSGTAKRTTSRRKTTRPSKRTGRRTR